MQVFLNGTAMSGGSDHVAIAGARFIAPARTAERYRFFSVRDEFPGLVPAADGASIVGELYELSPEVWHQSLLPQEPEELAPGVIDLLDGQTAHAMILDLNSLAPGDYRDITEFGGWRAYLAQTQRGVPASRTT